MNLIVILLRLVKLGKLTEQEAFEVWRKACLRIGEKRWYKKRGDKR